jgi:hypothetical protein
LETAPKDFETFRGRYIRKFQDIIACLATEGLTIQKIA